MLAEALAAAGVPCHVLNAKNDAKEAEIIAKAGEIGAVTVSTNMAGRGVDIRLGGGRPHASRSCRQAGRIVRDWYTCARKRADRQPTARALWPPRRPGGFRIFRKLGGRVDASVRHR